MGGDSVFRVTQDDPNVIIGIYQRSGANHGPKVLPEIADGDKEYFCLMIPYALARIPSEGEARGNLAAEEQPKQDH